MYRYFCSFVFVVAPLFGAAEQKPYTTTELCERLITHQKVNIETDNLLISANLYDKKKACFHAKLKNAPQEHLWSIIKGLSFRFKGRTYSHKLNLDYRELEAEACIAIAKQIYEPLLGQRIKRWYTLTHITCVCSLLDGLPPVSLLKAGFQFSHTDRFKFYFIYPEVPVSEYNLITPEEREENQKDLRAALELLTPKLPAGKSLEDLIA